MEPIGVDEVPIDWTNKQKFEYWFKRANDLYNTRNDPFEGERDIVWYIETLERYITEYMYYKSIIDVDTSEKLRLTDVMWLTYNPKQDITLRKALQSVESFIKKDKITNYIYVIEQRGTSEHTMGDFHIHILHKHKYDRATHYKRETQSTFRKTCNVDNYSCLNMKPCDTDEDVKKRLNYILGEKKDIDGLNKTQKQVIDKEYRKKYMLKDYYTDSFPVWEKYMI